MAADKMDTRSKIKQIDIELLALVKARGDDDFQHGVILSRINQVSELNFTMPTAGLVVVIDASVKIPFTPRHSRGDRLIFGRGYGRGCTGG